MGMVAVIQAPSLFLSSAAATAATPARAFCILGFPSPLVMPFRDAPSNLWHSPSRMANVSTTSPRAERSPNEVAPSSSIYGGRSWAVFASPRSGRGLAQSTSRIFACCGPFGVRRAVNLSFVQSISGFLGLHDSKPRTRLYALVGTTKTSNSSTSRMRSKCWTKRLAFRLSFADIITWQLRPWVEVNAGLWGTSSFVSRLSDFKMLVAPQAIGDLPYCTLPFMFCTTNSWMICAESCLSVPHRYWLNIRAGLCRMNLDFKAILGGCISSKVATKARFPQFSNPNS